MSWHFSRALEAAFSAASCSDGELSALSSGNHTPQAYLSPDRMTAFSRLFRFGMMFEPLTDTRGEELLTWFRAGFRARTSALPEKAQESTVSDPACGRTWPGLLARYDPDSRSWRTVQPSLLADWGESSVTWPRSGMTAGGLCLELLTLERPTSGTGFGWWPTPCATDNSDRAPSANVHISKTGLPKHIAPNGEKSQMRLSQAVRMWPTPTVCGNHNRKGASATSGDGLSTAVKTWATPVARDFRHPGRSRLERTGGKQGECLPQQVGGALNPMWVEWLMGWPLGWTDLKPSATDKSPNAQRQHGECLEVAE